MNPFEEALEALKSELKKVNPALKLSDPPADLRTSKNLFADPTLLPAGTSVKSDSFIDPQQSDYSDQVLQAAYNIAELMLKSLVTNQGAIGKNFAYMESTWVPKIIDEKTYKASKAFLTLINAITTRSDVAEQIPWVVRSTVIKQLVPISETIKNRIEAFEAHQPETLTKTVHALKMLNTWHQEADTFRQQTDPDILRKVLEENTEMLRIEPNPTEEYISEIEAIIEAKRKLSADIQARIDEVTVPDTVVSSEYIDALVKGADSQETQRQWQLMKN